MVGIVSIGRFPELVRGLPNYLLHTTLKSDSEVVGGKSIEANCVPWRPNSQDTTAPYLWSDGQCVLSGGSQCRDGFLRYDCHTMSAIAWGPKRPWKADDSYNGLGEL